MSLLKQHCVPCRGDEAPMDQSEIDKYLQEVPEWSLENDPDRLVRNITGKNFMQLVEMISNIAEIAEKQGHHPNLNLHDYKKLDITVYTHKTRGLHLNDFILARHIDALLEKFQIS